MDKDVAMNCFGFQNFNERYSCKALKNYEMRWMLIL